MRIVQLTAGTGSFYCGTCLRDNALVAELRRQGHDALLVPLYLPLALDEEPATPDAPLFYGGVSVYLQQKASLFRKTPRWVDRLLDSPALLRAAAKRAGMTDASDLGDLTLSMLRGEEGYQAKELDRLVDWLADEVRPDAVFLSNVLLIGLARGIKSQTGAAVACFLNGEHAFLDALPDSHRQACWGMITERAEDVNAFLPVSHYYSDLMREHARLPAERLHVVYPGIRLDGYGGQGADGPACAEVEPARAGQPAPPAATGPGERAPAVGFLARMCPDKGLETLVEAYLLLRARERIPNLRLRVAGACTASDEPFVERLRGRLEAAGAVSTVEFLPNLDRDQKIAFLRSLSVLSVPATYGEAFGLYVIEALAAGVPVVQPRHGAFPELLEITQGGLLCKPEDPASLAGALEQLLADRDAARAMGERGRRAVFERFSVERMATGLMDVMKSRVEGRSPAKVGSA